MTDQEYVLSLIANARKAQQEFEKCSQEEVDKATRAIGKKIYDYGDPLAAMAAEETGLGDYKSKILKNVNKAKFVWYRMKGVKSRGIIERDEEAGIIKVAKPIGVIGCVPPTTNPTMTPMHNAMCALKGGNALIVSPHPRAKQTTVETCRLMREALKEAGFPEDLIQCVEQPTIEISGLIMQMCDATIATGGPGMVKSAYSSGKPSFGVGAGNVQTIIDRGTDISEAAAMIKTSRVYDNGVLCTCEQCVHVPEEMYEEMVQALKDLGAYYISEPDEIDEFRRKLFGTGSIDKRVLGRPAVEIAELLDMKVPENTALLMVRIEKYGEEEPLSREKLCPVLAIASYDIFENAVAHVKKNLLNEGIGHSVVIHSTDQQHIEYAGIELPVSRIGVNMIGSSGLGGGLDNSLMPTATLGCGSWGNNSISENLWWNHLVNIARIAYRKKGVYVPTDEEIWGE